MVEVIGEEAETAVDFTTMEVIPVLVRRGENVGLTETIVLDAHDCGNDVGFGVGLAGGEAPDSLEQELLIRSFLDELAVAGSDELDLIGGDCHVGTIPQGGRYRNPLGPVRTVKNKYFFRDSNPASDSREIFQPLPPAPSSRYTIPFRSISGSSQSFPSPSLHLEQSNPRTSPVSWQ